MKTLNDNTLTIASLFSRFFVGFGAGFIGTVVLGIVLFLTWGIVGDTLSPSDVIRNEFGTKIDSAQTHPLFLSIVTLAIFLSTLVANLAHVFISTLVNEKYNRRTTALTQVFFGNLVFLLLLLPAYMILSKTLGAVGITASGILHLVVATFFSFFITEALHQSKYLIVSVYGNLLGIVLFFIIGSLINGSGTATASLLLALPLLLGLMALGNRIAELIYAWIYKSYGSDFLNIDTQFGEDYGQKDKEGSQDFEV